MIKSTIKQICCDMHSGGTPSTKHPEYWNGSLPWLSSSETSHDYINKSNKFITEIGVKKSSTILAEKDSVLIATAGEGKTRGQVSYLNIDAYINQSIIALKANPKYMLQKYLYYYLKNSYSKLRSLSDITGVRGSLSGNLLGDFEISYPDITSQSKIVNLLSCLDKKISLNNSICFELESLSKLLYDYWFVQFDFPDKNGRPYKSSGGKMVWNEELKREIPERWDVKKLTDIIDISRNKISAKDIGDRLYIPIESIPKKKMSFYQTTDVENALTGLCYFDEKAILLSNIRVYFHKVSISPFKGITRNTVIIIYPKKKTNLGFVFQQVFSEHFIVYATRNSGGTEQPVLSPDTVKNYLIAYPSDNLDEKYSHMVASMIDEVLSLQKENRNLTNLRDFLLPMLMNGQVKIESH